MAWRTVDSVTFYPCLDFMIGKALVAHSVVAFNTAFAGVLGSIGVPTRIFWGLNVLGGFGDKSPSGPGGEQARAAAARAREAVEAVPMPKERPAPQEALAALLRADARYGDSERAGNIAPFGSASVSPPSRDLHGVDIYDVLPLDASHKFKRLRDTILLSDEECALRIKSEGLPNPYFDPVLEAHPANRLQCASDQTIFLASLDIKDYLHELRIDEELPQYLALPAVRAAAVGVESINGIKVGPSELFSPALQSLPMGFSWAVRAAQLVHEELLRQAGLPPARLLRDCIPPPSLEGGPVQLTCVDNFGVLGCDKAEVEATHRQALEGIRHAGFHVHEIEQVSTSLDIVGVHLDGGKKAAGGGPKNLWLNVGRELLIAAALLPLVYADIGAGWLDQVVATDACHTGLGSCAAEWGSPGMRITGSFDERWRIKKEARGAKLGFKHVVRGGRRRHSKALMLVDNMSLTLAIKKGRCRDPALVGQLRQMTALQLATGLRVRCRWVPSEVEDYHRRIEEFYEYSRRQGLDVSPTKTGVYDDNVAMNHENLQFLGLFFKLYRQEKGTNDSLWGLAQAELGAMVAKALKVCRLEVVGVITGRRSQVKVQRRGRWASMSSRIRHEKSSKVDFLLVGLDDSVQEYRWLCTAHLGDPFLNIFAGSKGVGKTVARCGISSPEIQLEPEIDIFAPGIIKALLKLISSGRVQGIFVAAPCRSFSIARVLFVLLSTVHDRVTFSYRRGGTATWVQTFADPRQVEGGAGWAELGAELPAPHFLGSAGPPGGVEDKLLATSKYAAAVRRELKECACNISTVFLSSDDPGAAAEMRTLLGARVEVVEQSRLDRPSSPAPVAFDTRSDFFANHIAMLTTHG
ncbi:unnamed protein product [Prorocentrum cordatum]|uniref:Uncharacterized protein n=1 Tax=Prorocentrum cordatum TaxID=2364126 RepID=A0ABN9SJ23_9DINO|nr:unnamed protein product [Polarella glacialis]